MLLPRSSIRFIDIFSILVDVRVCVGGDNSEGWPYKIRRRRTLEYSVGGLGNVIQREQEEEEEDDYNLEQAKPIKINPSGDWIDFLQMESNWLLHFLNEELS